MKSEAQLNPIILTKKIKAKAYEAGYDLCGIIDAEPIAEYVTYLNERIKKFPESKNLFEDLYDLAYPKDKVSWAKSIVVCIRRYSKYKIPEDLKNHIGKLYLFDRRLDYTEEYNSDIIFESFLHENNMLTYKNEVAARWAAVKAGLGVFGKNNFLYTKFGSWVAIDTWIVNTEMEYDKPSKKTVACRPNCRLCIDACPTKALSNELMMNMGKCIAQLSYYSTEIYSNELIPEELRDKMGTWLYGCDICQDVCPMNKNKWEGVESFPKLDAQSEALKLENIVQMDEKTFFDTVYPRFDYIDTDGLWIWKCNALRAMMNSKDTKYNKYIKAACQDENKNVREMAEWICQNLNL